MENIIENYNQVFNKCSKINPNSNLIIISKSRPIDEIKTIIDRNHFHFGENKVQEAFVKWKDIKIINKNIQLHLVGKLQGNKIDKALLLFDYIHSLDNKALASKLSTGEKKLNKKIKYFIQVNTGKEPQKGGIFEEELLSFYKFCTEEVQLNILGLMCIPPISDSPRKHFQKLKELSKIIGNLELSMGMSNDFDIALEEGASYVRVGSAIFGPR